MPCKNVGKIILLMNAPKIANGPPKCALCSMDHTTKSRDSSNFKIAHNKKYLQNYPHYTLNQDLKRMQKLPEIKTLALIIFLLYCIYHFITIINSMISPPIHFLIYCQRYISIIIFD